MLCRHDRKMKELNIDAKAENIAGVTDFINEQIAGCGCSGRTQIYIDVAADELFSNIVKYAYGNKKGTVTIRTEIKTQPLSVMITFIDSGIPYDPLKSKDPDTVSSADKREIGGLGIYIVKKSMDSVGYEYKDGKNIITITKNLRN